MIDLSQASGAAFDTELETRSGASEARPPSPLTVFFAGGPGDLAGTYRQWATGNDDTRTIAVTFSAQVFEACHRQNVQLFTWAWNPSIQKLVDTKRRMTVQHVSIPYEHCGGIRYHLGRVIFGFQMLKEARRHQAKVAFVAEGTHWFMLSAFHFVGIKPVPLLLCVLWPKFRRPSKVDSIVLRLSKGLFRKHAFAILSMSNDITEQICKVAGGTTAPIREFFPLYQRNRIGPKPIPAERRPFRVLFIGRIETSKGVFDLLEVAKLLSNENCDYFFEVAGTGSQLDSLREMVVKAGLENTFAIRGFLNADELNESLLRCHVTIVPTTIDFNEGFNMAVVESVLAGRPVVTSTVCPAVNYLNGSVLTVQPGDIQGYADAIHQLASDATHYDSMIEAGKKDIEQFFDESYSFGASVEHILRSAIDGNGVASMRLKVSDRHGAAGQRRT